MRIQVNIPMVSTAVHRAGNAPASIGVIELTTDTEGDTITIRIGDATATVKRLDLVDATSTRLAPALVPYDPEGMGGGPILARRPR